MPPPDIDALQASTLELARRHGVPALALVLAVDGKHRVYAGGRSGRDGVAIDTHTPFRLGSITKTFTALATLLAVRDAGFGLDTPLERWGAPPLTNVYDRPITPRSLLEHTAGLADLSRREWDSNTELTLDAGLAVDPAARTTRWPPQRYHSYTNAGAGPLAWALRAATGRPWEDWLGAVFAYLELRDASLRLDPAVEARLPHGFKADGHTVIPWWRMHIGAYAAVNASAHDMLKVLRFLQFGAAPGAHRTLAGLAELADTMYLPRTSDAARAGLDFGYGLGIYPRSRNGHEWWGHGGDADGFRSRFGYLRSAPRAYFVVINIDAPQTLRALVSHLERALQADLVRPPVPPPAGVEVTDLAGRYRALTRRFGDPATASGVTITATTTGNLRVRGARVDERLLAVDARHFRRPADARATVVFIGTGSEVVMTGELGHYRRVP